MFNAPQQQPQQQLPQNNQQQPRGRWTNRVVTILTFFIVLNILSLIFDILTDEDGFYELFGDLSEAYNSVRKAQKKQKDAASSSSYSTTSGGSDVASKQKATELAGELAVAIHALNMAEIRKLLKNPALDPNVAVEGTGCPLVVTASKNEDHIVASAAATEKVTPLLILKEILKHPKIDPNGAINAWSPLKVALSNGNDKMVAALIAHKNTIPEVITPGLGCDVAKRVKQTLYFVVPSNAPECFKQHPRAIPESKSRMLKRNQMKHLAEKVAENAAKRSGGSSGGSGAQSSTKSAGASKNADHVFDKNVVVPPSAGDMVIHPGYFNSVYGALAFYFMGTELSSYIWVSVFGAMAAFGSLLLWSVLSVLSHARAIREETEEAAAVAGAGPQQMPPNQEAGNPEGQ